jgi:signal transduction histidine kinase
MTAIPLPRILFFTGLAVWVAVSLTTALRALDRSLLIPWGLASLVFITAFVLWDRRPGRLPPLLLAAQSASVVVMVAILCNGLEGLLLVLVAAQLALVSDRRFGITWIVVQSIAMGIGIGWHWSPSPAVLLSFPYLGFQLLMFVGLQLHAEARRLQAELAEKSRIEERLRITQELHDSIGHHLVALSLNLEWAAHESEGAARASVRSAQVLARSLLREVKAIVSDARQAEPVDLADELRRLAHELPWPKLHIDCPPELLFEDAHTSRALLRTAQEIITNAIRHGEARNLWIEIVRENGRVRLCARDDGQASAAVVEGVGLSGMRKRLEALGGSLKAAPSPSSGFEVQAELPVQAARPCGSAAP